jgi:PAS domain S-box-containing protein
MAATDMAPALTGVARLGARRSLLALTRDPDARWVNALMKRGQLVCGETTATTGGPFDIIVIDLDTIRGGVEAITSGVCKDVIAVARRFTNQEREALLRAGAAACVAKAHLGELDAVLDRQTAAIGERIDDESNFHTLCEVSFDAVMIHRRGRIIAANRQCAEMMHCTIAELIGRSVLDFTSPRFHEDITRRVEERDPRPFSCIGVRADGEEFPFEVRGLTRPGSDIRIVALRDITDRTIAEQELRAREERFRVLAQAAFDGILCERDGRIVEVNHAFAEMFGHAAERLAGMPVKSVIWIEPAANGGENAAPMEAVGLRADGTALPIEVCVASTADGQRIYAVRDETERRASEARLLESERRYRDLAESSHDLICDHDLDGHLLNVNAAAARALGMTREELLEMRIQDLIVPEVLPMWNHYVAMIAQHGVAEGLMLMRTRSGERRTWHYRNAMKLSGMERPVVHGLAHDVTDREAALEALQQSERHFRSIIENGSDVIGIIDREGRLTYHSPSAERLFGSDTEVLRNLHFLRVVHPEDRARAQAFFERHIGTPKLVSSIDLRVRHNDGSWRWLATVATTVRGLDGQPSLITTSRDITDRRQLEAQLEQANRLTSLGRLTATVAHEFNNVLMSIQPFADLIQKPGVSLEVAARGARHIANSIVRGKRVVMDMLRFARPAEPTFAPIDLQQFWEKLVPELQAPMGNTIDFTWSIPPSLVIRGDAAQLSQVFANLASNARDAMPRGGKLRVEASCENGSKPLVHIIVSDTGSGMPEHVLRHAFDPLFTTKQSSGTGLGLAVAYQVVTRHGGRIFAESEPGAGTTFHILLPLTAETPRLHEGRTEEPPIRARRVLIVDDEPSIVEGISIALQDRGMTTKSVQTGGAAEAAARELQPEVALIDMRLPDIDGLDVGAACARCSRG